MVVKPPGFDEKLGISEARKPVDVESLIAEAAIEALDEGGLDRLAGLDEWPLDPVLVGPVIEDAAGQFGSVIEHDRVPQLPFGTQVIEDADHTSTG